MSPDGRIFFGLRESGYDADAVVAWLKHLAAKLKEKLLIVWDNASIHRAASVKAFLGSPEAENIRLAALPPYAPELNPDEMVWSLLKRTYLSNKCCYSYHRLKSEMQRAFAELRKRPEVISNFFRHTGLFS